MAGKQKVTIAITVFCYENINDMTAMTGTIVRKSMFNIKR